MSVLFFFLNYNIFFMIISIYIILFMPIFDTFINLFKINVSFLLFKIVYYNLIDNKFNYNYNYLINRRVHVIDNFYYKDYTFINYKYKYFLGIKYKLYIILMDHFTIYIKDYESIRKINVDNTLYYDKILTLTYKYSKYFKNIDIYLLNNIKEFLY